MPTIRAVYHVNEMCFHMHVLKTEDNINEILEMHSKIVESFTNYDEAEAYMIGLLLADSKKNEYGSYSITKEFTNREFEDPTISATVFEHMVDLDDDEG